jgi:DNA-binding MarR family transcriptional regulator
VLALQRATHATLDALAAELAELGLGPAELNVLANLGDGRPRTVSDLAAAVGSRPTTMTSVLDRLERRGHLIRTTHPEDRRALVITLTTRGRRAATAVRRAVRRIEQRALGELSAETSDVLRAALDALTEVRNG